MKGTPEEETKKAKESKESKELILSFFGFVGFLGILLKILVEHLNRWYSLLAFMGNYPPQADGWSVIMIFTTWAIIRHRQMVRSLYGQLAQLA
ncbi:MAG: hypothetical protein ABIA92_03930 [Patescibacteria group bacterium]